MKMKVLFVLTLIISVALSLQAQDIKNDKSALKAKIDTTKFNETAHRHGLLTAGTFSRPRDISIGIPVTDPGHFLIVENDLPVTYYNLPQGPQSVWRPDGNFSDINLMNLHESLIQYGWVGYATKSYDQNGIRPISAPPGIGAPGTMIPIPDKFQGVLNYNTDDYGLNEFDISFSSPIGKNWYLSANTFQNYDPGYNKIPYHLLDDRLSIFRFSITKKFNHNKGDISLYYRHADTRDLFPINGDSPFVYDGNGKISELNGIKWGTDYFGNSDGFIQYVDIKTGVEHTTSFYDATHNYSTNLQYLFHYNFSSGVKLKSSARWNYVPYAGVPIQVPLQTYDLSNPAPGTPTYSLRDGTPYTGVAQQWLSLFNQGRINDGMFMTELGKKTGKNDWKIGVDFFYHFQETSESSCFYNTTATINPQMLSANLPPQVGGGVYSGFNLAGGFYTGHEVKTAIYASDNWTVSKRLKIYAGLRLDYLSVNGKNLPYNPLPGFYMGSGLTGQSFDGVGNPTFAPGTVATLVPFSHNYVLPSATLEFTYNLSKTFGLLANYSFSKQGYGLNTYGNLGGLGQQAPSVKAVSFEYGRAGIFYNNPYINLVSAFTFMYSPRNIPFALNTMYQGTPVSLLQVYDIETLGWTTDMLINPGIKGFNLHFLVQYFDPKYKNFKLQPTGDSPVFNYSGKIVTGVPKLTLEIDPTFVPAPAWRIWASFRYYSKTYGSISNLIYFAPHWETFAGINWQANKKLGLGFNVVNIFNQLGITGMIPGSEFVTPDQTQQYLQNVKGFMSAGSYLRPLSFNFSVQVKF
ncbi:MAG: TonB-dependent receptor [Bacteroidales bacterium]|nr:TonB-dependent receptor [Bacteroidales bacterium]